MIKSSVAQDLGAKIKDSTQMAYQADGITPLDVVGETTITFTRDDNTFTFEGLVVNDIDVDLLGGVPFLEMNDITLRPKQRSVILADGTTYNYGTLSQPRGPHTINRVQAHILRSHSTTTVWPGDFVDSVQTGEPLALEPRTEAPVAISSSCVWPPPDIISEVGGRVRIPNNTEDPIILRKNEHFCHVHKVFSPTENPARQSPPIVAVTKTSSPKPLTHAHSQCNM